jgi:hypothetical protein
VRFPCRVLRAGEVTPGKLVLCPLNDERLIRASGKEVWAEMHQHPSPGLRSDSARNYQWGVVYAEIANETGNDPKSLHYGLKREAVRVGVLPPEYILAGTTLLEAEPTTKQESEVFWHYIHWIREGAETGSLFGVKFHIPEPNE